MPRADIAILTVIPEEYEAVIASLSSYGCNTEHDPGSATVPNLYGWVTGDLSGAGGQGYRVVVGIVVKPGPDDLPTPQTIEVAIAVGGEVALHRGPAHARDLACLKACEPCMHRPKHEDLPANVQLWMRIPLGCDDCLLGFRQIDRDACHP
jgi:hypothetical protein